MKQNLVLIVNQYAGINQHNRKEPIPGKWKKIGSYVIDTLKKHFELDINITGFGKDSFVETTRKKAKEYYNEKDTIYVFVGGDDSFDYGITELLKTGNSSYTEAYIPTGEGVALKHAFGLHDDIIKRLFGLHNLETALNLIIHNKEESAKIDVINFNNERYGFYGGFGLFGLAVLNREISSVSGPGGFIWPAVKSYFACLKGRYRKRYLAFKTDGKSLEKEEKSIGILVSKIPYIGGGLKLIPKAKLNDGKLHVVSYGFSLGIINELEVEYLNIEPEDHIHYGGDYQGKDNLQVRVEKEALNMVLNKKELERNGTLLN